MLSPEYLLRISEGGEAIAESLHQDILDRIIERISLRLDRGDNYLLTAQDKWQIEVLQDAGYLREDVEKEIAKATGLMQTEIAEAMEEAGVKSLEYDDSIYKAAGLSPVPLTESPYLIRLMQRTFEATLGEWKNFTRTTADAVQQTFIQACDNAYIQVASGSVGYSQAYVEAINKMTSEGVALVKYSKINPLTGEERVHVDTIETATLRCIRTGISQATAQITDARMEEMNWDIILVSSHLGARVNDKEDYTNHYWWQGKFYSKSGNDKRFPPYSVCGEGNVQGIHGANCRHSHGPGDGEFNPFDQYDSEENQKEYELQQKQRSMERRIRQSKQKTMGLKKSVECATTAESKAALEEQYQKAAALLQKRNQAYNDFCKENNLKKRNERITIAQWDRKQAAQARAAAKKWNNKPDGMARLSKKQIDKSVKTDIIKTEDINRIDTEEGKNVQGVISNVLRTEKENINLDGLPVQSQRYVLSATRKVIEKFPQLKEYTKKIVYNPTIDATARSASLTGTIEIGPDFMDLEKLQKDHSYGVKLKFHPKGTEDLTSLVVHEYGHQLDGYLTLKGVYGGSVSQYGTVRTSVAVQKEVLRRAGLSDERLREIRKEWLERGYTGKDLSYAVRWERKDFITDHLSEYATENSNEFFAECFMEYMSSDKPREVAQIFGEVLTEIMEGL